MQLKKIVATLFATGIMAAPQAYATNGMLMEGYGPISTGMGGASMAFDNGAAGMANNPATLGLMSDNTSRLDVALGGLHPSITATCAAPQPCAGMASDSGGTSYFMPAAGWVKKSGQMSYGVGMFAQGGMGTEYNAMSWVGAGSGLPSRSEVSVGNLIVPLAYNVTPDLTIAGSLDFVWGGMDLQMAMPAAQMGQLAATGNLTATGPAAAGMGAFMGGATNVGYFNFSDGSSFTGKARATGWKGKLGMTYKAGEKVTVGASYQSRTSMGDLTTNGAQLLMITPLGTTTMAGTVNVVNFQFPDVYGFGMSLQATDDLMLAADYKRIGWKNVMQNFHMTFTNTMLAMDMKMPQNWKDQDVFNLGVAYKTSPALTLRAGASLANNPIPDNTVNPLFPATVTNHLMAGFGYGLASGSEINGSMTYVPKVTVNSPNGYSIKHSQINWQLMYTIRY